MTDRKLLRQTIENSGLKITALCDKTGILRSMLYKRLDGKGDFTVPEIEALTRELHLSATERDQIFFASQVAKQINNDTQEG